MIVLVPKDHRRRRHDRSYRHVVEDGGENGRLNRRCHAAVLPFLALLHRRSYSKSSSIWNDAAYLCAYWNRDKYPARATAVRKKWSLQYLRTRKRKYCFGKAPCRSWSWKRTRKGEPFCSCCYCCYCCCYCIVSKLHSATGSLYRFRIDPIPIPLAITISITIPAPVPIAATSKNENRIRS